MLAISDQISSINTGFATLRTPSLMQTVINFLNEGPHRVVRPVIDALMQQITPQQNQTPKDPE